MPKKRFSPEQIIATLRHIEVQLAQGKSIALACKEGAISVISGLSATCACSTGGDRTAATHSHNHAVIYQSAWSKIPVWPPSRSPKNDAQNPSSNARKSMPEF